MKEIRLHASMTDVLLTFLALVAVGAALAMAEDREAACEMSGYEAARLDSIEPIGRDKDINCWFSGDCIELPRGN